jgi:asparagine synthase (glutamine-hydrolysing)
MSHFLGYLSLSENIDVLGLKDRILNKGDSLFKSDNVATYQTDQLLLVNWFIHNTPESNNNTTICESERYTLIASCRLDNREELISLIESKRGKTIKENHSDHFLLLYLFELFHEQCVDFLVGDFSFVVWCKTTEMLFMVKDHLGVRPLFYHKMSDDSLVFSTSISLIKQAVNKPLKLNLRYISGELKDIPPSNVEETFFEDVFRLKPAHYILFNKSTNFNAQEVRYWSLNTLDLSKFSSEKDIYKKLEQLFLEAVMCRTRTHKNIGCQLSGGMDSSAIAVLLARNFDRNRIHTYSFVLSEKTLPYSKTKIDEKSAQQIVLNHAKLKLDNHHLIEDFHYIDAFDEWQQCNKIMGGYGNSDCIWEDTLFMNASKNQVGFIMSGFPGDECVSTYGQTFYYDYLHHTKIGEILKFIFLSPLPNSKKVISYYLTKYKLKSSSAVNQERNLLKANTMYDKSMNHQNLLGNAPTFKDYLKHKICGVHPTLRMESEFLYASQYGIEPVYPLADIRLIQFVYSLPTEMFRPKKHDRVVFREMCKNILPDSIRLQPKVNGAFTLAFVEYWKEKQIEDLKNYEVIDSLELFHSKGKVSWEKPEKKRQIAKCKMDFLINVNLKDGKE